MADIVDITADREEHNIAHALRAARKVEAPAATGRCFFCDEIVADSMRFCDAECRDMWDRERSRKGF
jgi:hypothetical protein